MLQVGNRDVNYSITKAMRLLSNATKSTAFFPIRKPKKTATSESLMRAAKITFIPRMVRA